MRYEIKAGSIDVANVQQFAMLLRNNFYKCDTLKICWYCKDLS